MGNAGGGERAEDLGIEVVTASISLDRLQTMSEGRFGDLVKAVVDIRRGVMAIGGELHADEEATLLDGGSEQADLWGINLYPAEFGQLSWLEFDSMINVRPGQGNRSRSVDDPALQERIVDVVGRLVR